MQLSTGREIYANADIIGIDDDLVPTGGYDNPIHEAELTRPDWFMPDDEWEPMSIEEKVEFSNLMIARWKAYQEKAISNEG